MPFWEIIAVLFAIAYLVLAIRQNIWCWVAAGVSTAIYIAVMYRAGLYMEAALQVFYVAMAFYGWWQWVGVPSEKRELRIQTWPATRHFVAVLGIAGMSLLSGSLLEQHTDAAMPYLDSLTTWGAILATWMVARKMLENWIYWFVIDSVSVFLYISRGLYPTAALFVLYLVLIVIGYRAWNQDLKQLA